MAVALKRHILKVVFFFVYFPLLFLNCEAENILINNFLTDSFLLNSK